MSNSGYFDCDQFIRESREIMRDREREQRMIELDRDPEMRKYREELEKERAQVRKVMGIT